MGEEKEMEIFIFDLYLIRKILVRCNDGNLGGCEYIILKMIVVKRKIIKCI